MPLYFQAIAADTFDRQIRVVLTDSWRMASFEPCLPFCRDLLSQVQSQTSWLYSEELTAVRILSELQFDRDQWRLLAGELFLLCAEEAPYIPLSPETMCCLLAPEAGLEPPRREAFAPIHHALFGANDLAFGQAYYRPDRAGYNGRRDVARLADYLWSLDTSKWSAASLASLSSFASAEEREEELEFVRDWFGAFRELYQQARARDWIVVCESA